MLLEMAEVIICIVDKYKRENIVPYCCSMHCIASIHCISSNLTLSTLPREFNKHPTPNCNFWLLFNEKMLKKDLLTLTLTLVSGA